MRQTQALKNMQRMIESLREPIAEERDCFCIPLLEEIQNPQIVVNFRSNEIDVVACEVHVALTELLA